MNMTMYDGTDLQNLKKEGWTFRTTNFQNETFTFSGIDRELRLKEAEDIVSQIEPHDMFGEEHEDLLVGINTETKYKNLGVAAFSSYREYRRNRLEGTETL